MSCTSCFGQSSFQEITPGASKRDDVARVLGQPVRSISSSLLEYAPPAGIAKLEVEYRAGSDVVDRIEIYFDRPISRQALIQKFGLTQEDAKKSTEGKLVEYFEGASLLAFAYSSTDTGSGVSHIGYYSRKLFDSAMGKTTGARQYPGTQTSNSQSGSGPGSLGEMKLPDHMRPPPGSSSANVDRAGRGSSTGGNSTSAGSVENKRTKNRSRTSPSSDDSLQFTLATTSGGLEVQPSTKPGANSADSGNEEVSVPASDLRKMVGVYQFIQPSGPGVKPAAVSLVAGKLRLTMSAATYTLEPILRDDFVVGDQGESDLFSFRAAGELGVKVYFTIVEDRPQHLYIVENQRQPKRFSVAVPKL